jgi:hypothetical protein
MDIVCLVSTMKAFGIKLWRFWAKALGEKASTNDSEADKIAIIRSIIVLIYIITNFFIIAGVLRHWND